MIDPATTSELALEYMLQVRGLGCARRARYLARDLLKFQDHYESHHPGRSFLESLDRTLHLAQWVASPNFLRLPVASRRIKLHCLRGFTNWLFKTSQIDHNAWFYVPFAPAVAGSVPALVMSNNMQREIACFGDSLQGKNYRSASIQAAHLFNLHCNRPGSDSESEEESLLLWLNEAVQKAPSQVTACSWIRGVVRFLDYRVARGRAERNLLREWLSALTSCNEMVRRLSERPDNRSACDIRQLLESVARPPFFRSPLAIEHFEELVDHQASRRRIVRGLRIQLRVLDRVIFERGNSSTIALEHEALERYLAQGSPEPRTYNARLQFLRKLYRFLSRRHVRMANPDRFWPKRTEPDFHPHIYTLNQIGEILQAVRRRRERSRSVFHWRGLEAIIFLLYACGLRLNEPLGLRIRDVDLQAQLLLVVRTKFYKQRWVPISPRTVEVLSAYRACRDGAYGPALDTNEPFFLNARGRRFGKGSVIAAFREVAAGLAIQCQGSRPNLRLHDLRHTFAVHKLYQWYSEGLNVQNKLPLLATYLGHLHYRHTEVYLHLTEDLLRQAGQNFRVSFEKVVAPWIPSK